MTAIHAEAVSHFYGKGSLRKQILFDINVDIPQGEIVIVTGPSGSGKTTLLTLIGALRSTQAGSLKVLDHELCGASNATMSEMRRKIGFIFQQHNLVAALSAFENVELGLGVTGRYRGQALGNRAREMLEAVGLSERMHHKPEQMSGGQRQRVAIARALASEPALLLADEPTASLDKESGREVVERMRTLANDQGTTILIVTHDNRILDVADRIVHLEDGKLISFTESVIASNKHMMSMLAESNERSTLQSVVDHWDEDEFKSVLTEMSEESLRFLEATTIANNKAYQSMLERSLFAFTRKIASLVSAERASLFLVDGDSLRLRVTEQLPVQEEIRIPWGSGIVGAAVESGETVMVKDAYKDDRFNPEVDKQMGYRTRATLAIPIKDRDGRTFAAIQLLNKNGEGEFDAEDETRVAGVLEELSLILESWVERHD
ncbi:MAG: ATP-binding cassette domain-containing protein [Pseudomonadales bacterium]|nr:ATP-binding cassette domain-containing protein [Pseudomonadales bacterium]MBO6597140.1 ATP-binding cassette domain-containing protein [Pseudomonadales bacterium]MBO6823673.1 ATP-binding cassette domain-containing protein [Pseudomonadales bacterium]